MPIHARLFGEVPQRTWVLCGRDAPTARRLALERRGVQVFPIARRGTGLDLKRGLERIARQGVRDLLVEGGGEVAAGLLRRGLVDEIHWFVAPRWIGAEGRPALGPLGIDALASAPRLDAMEVRRLGMDLHVRGRVRGVEGSR